MAWIESHQSLATHRKLYKLSSILGIGRPQAVGHLHFLWWWALDNASNGNLQEIPGSVVEDVVGWAGEPLKFYNALIESEWIDSDTLTLHNWQNYAGKLISRRENDKIRHRKSLGTPQEIQKKSTATVPNSTVPNSTNKKVKKESEVYSIPEWLDEELWDAFLEMRKKKKDPPTDYAKKLLIGDLRKIKESGKDPNEALKESIKRGWKGVLFQDNGGNNGTNRQDSQGTKKYTPGPVYND
jgi:hypothetical protein